MSAFQATVGGRFAPVATLVDEDADLDAMVTNFNKAVTDTVAELLGKQRRKRKLCVTPEILDFCDQRRDLKKNRGEPEGTSDYREIKKRDQDRYEDGKKRLGYRVNIREWTHASERIIGRKHTSLSRT